MCICNKMDPLPGRIVRALQSINLLNEDGTPKYERLQDLLITAQQYTPTTYTVTTDTGEDIETIYNYTSGGVIQNYPRDTIEQFINAYKEHLSHPFFSDSSDSSSSSSSSSNKSPPQEFDIFIFNDVMHMFEENSSGFISSIYQYDKNELTEKWYSINDSYIRKLVEDFPITELQQQSYIDMFSEHMKRLREQVKTFCEYIGDKILSDYLTCISNYFINAYNLREPNLIVHRIDIIDVLINQATPKDLTLYIIDSIENYNIPPVNSYKIKFRFTKKGERSLRIRYRISKFSRWWHSEQTKQRLPLFKILIGRTLLSPEESNPKMNSNSSSSSSSSSSSTNWIVCPRCKRNISVPASQSVHVTCPTCSLKIYMEGSEPPKKKLKKLRFC